MTRTGVITAGLFIFVSSASADEVVLRNGSRISGQVVERSASSVTIDVGPGRVTLPMSRVEQIVDGTSQLGIYRERASRLGANAEGWLALAHWADERGLNTQAREAYERVLALDDDNAAAHRALGHVMVAGRWLSEEEGYRVRGFVAYEGQWVTPEERGALAQQHANEALAARERIEADARAREAQARADAAESEARRARAEADATDSGLPFYPYLWGGGGVYGGNGYAGNAGHGSRAGHHGGGGYGAGSGGGVQGPPQAPPVRQPPVRDSNTEGHREHREHLPVKP